MAYIIYDKEFGRVTGYTETNPFPDGNISEGVLVFQGTIDTENNFLGGYKLNAAGDGVENPYTGTVKEQTDAFKADQDKAVWADLKAVKKQQVGLHAKYVLDGDYSNTSWKVEKAKEVDLLAGNNNAMTALALEKKAIRDANNAHEAVIEALDPNDPADQTKIKDFDPTDFVGKY